MKPKGFVAAALIASCSEKLNLDATFVCCDIYDAPKHLDEKFDIVFSSVDDCAIVFRVSNRIDRR
jgi:hypothetical protein